MSDDELAFIRSASVEPEEDTIRLVYADWLDERGDDTHATLATFVRLQVHRTRTSFLDPNYPDLLAEENALFQKHKRRWNGRIHRRLAKISSFSKVDARRGPIRSWQYHRGMITQITVTPEALLKEPETIFGLGPIESLHLTASPTRGLPFSVALQTHISQLKSLKLSYSYPLTISALSPFAGVPLLDLRSNGTYVQPQQLWAWAQSRTLSPVILYKWRAGETTYDAVIDPHRKWDSLRLWYSGLVRELLPAESYQVTTQ